MLFVVELIEGRRKKSDQYPHVLLIQNNWDDYHYKTTFYAVFRPSATEEIELGDLKILKKDQRSGYTKLPEGSFEVLGENYCSLGGDLAYYETLFKQGKTFYRPYLRALRDVTFNDIIKADFEDLEGFQVSLLRTSGAKRTISDARKLFQKTKRLTIKRRSKGFNVRFKTRVSPNSKSFRIDFDFRRRGSLPNRINVLIGYNGTGKTRLLSNLAIVASGYGYASKKDILDQAAGRFVGNQPPFKTVVVVSYSAFDTFVIPGRTDIEKKRMQKEGAIFGYAYCGLREHADESLNESKEQVYRLKTQGEIETEFLTALNRVRVANRMEDLLEILKPLLNDASFKLIGLTELYTNQDDEEILDLFRGLSSGHKSVIKIVVELTAHIDGNEPTLVLMDEPETHLHPPLLAAFLKSIRSCLERFDGYALIATHSPVVLQEMPSRFVHVLRRLASQSQVKQTRIESFGESIGVITQEVFNLDDGSTDWHDTLRTLARKRGLAEIEEMFGRSLGFSARSEVLSIHDEVEE